MWVWLWVWVWVGVVQLAEISLFGSMEREILDALQQSTLLALESKSVPAQKTAQEAWEGTHGKTTVQCKTQAQQVGLWQHKPLPLAGYPNTVNAT